MTYKCTEYATFQDDKIILKCSLKEKACRNNRSLFKLCVLCGSSHRKSCVF